jgi:Mg2+ and Co2+ transporter CorA
MINDEYRDYRDSQMNDTLFLLTLITICIIPAQFLTGLFGMNFTKDDGAPPRSSSSFAP